MNDSQTIQQQIINENIIVQNDTNQQKRNKLTDRKEILQSVEGGAQSPQISNQLQVNRSINRSINDKILNISIRQKRKVEESDEEIDEEEFQEYFQNPQKRKEFDLQRLQQQVKEIQSIAGFQLDDFGGISMKELRQTYPSKIKLEEEVKKNPQKNYATISLCCLSVTNPFRIIVIDLVLGNPWFDRFFLSVIVANSIIQAMDNEIDVITNQGDLIDYIFLSLYTIEMILKIVAMGFFMRPFSYLRDPWNVLDFTVIFLGWISNLFSGSNISSFRVIRILRPLKTINSMPGMSTLITTILNSLPFMIDILVLFCFMILMFGVVGTQILGGALRFRCMVSDSQGNLTVQMDKYGNEQFCQKQTDNCPILYPNRNISCQDYGNPVSGTYNFDNLGFAIFNIFQMITLESWSTMMYTVRDATGSRIYDFYFLLIVVIGTFIVLNLMIAVQVQNLSQSFREQDIINKQVQDQKDLKEQDKDENEEEDENQEQEESNEEKDERTSDVKKEKKKRCCNIKRNEELEKIRAQIFEVVSAPSNWFAKMMLGFIILNTIFLCSEFYEQPDWIFQVQFYGNYVFAIIFLIETLIKLFAYGLIDFFKDNFNIFDLIIVVLSCYDTFSPGEANGYSVFRAFRLVSIFRIVKSWTGLRKLLETIIDSLPSVSNLGVLILLWLFIYSLLGKQFFNYQLYDTNSGELARYSFQKSWQAFVTTFCLLVQDNWNEVMLEVYNQSDKNLLLPAVYFFSAVIVGCNLLLNLFIAILLSFIEKEETIDENNSSQNDQSQEAKQSKAETQRSQINQGDNSQEMENNSGSSDEDLQKSKSNSFNSKMSNNDDEYERIKMQLQTLSNIKIAEQKRKLAQEKKIIKAQQKSEEAKRMDTESYDQRGKQINQEQQDSDFKKTKNGKPVPINMLEIQTYNDKSLNQQIRKTKSKKQIDIDLDSRSLFIFSHDNRFRQFLKQMYENVYFDDLIYHIIGLNSFLLILDAPILTDQFQVLTVNLLQNIISGIFIAEFFIKIIVMGFFMGRKSYLKDQWNCFDFIIVLFSIITWVLSSFRNIDLSFTKGFRALRALRPLRMVSKHEGIKTVVNAILFALPSLFNVIVIISMLLLIFAILGLQLMKGGTGSCNDIDSSIKTKADCQGFYKTPIFDEQGQLTGTNQTERVWTFPFANYNNIFSSLITFFIIATKEDWASKMFMAMDVVGEDKVLVTNYSPAMCLIYIIFIFITSFFVLNLFISVIVDQFNVEIKKRQGSANFNEEQKEWVKLQRLLCLTEPKIIPVEPINCLRLQCFKVIQSQAFEYIVMLAILCNTVFLCIDNYDKSEKLSQVLKIANIFFVSFFTVECFLKCIAYGFTYYWHVNWNKFDLFIVLLSLLLIDDSILSQSSVNITCLRVLRVARLLRMIKSSEGLRSLLKALYLSLENILTTASLLLLLFFTFTVAGISLFGNMTFDNTFSPNVNFQSFYIGTMTLFRASTGENWASLMTDCYQQTGIVAILFWLIFQSSTYFIFLNVFIAVVYESFAEIQSSENENDILSLKKKDIKAFQNTWAKFNPMGELYMRTLKLSDFLRDLPPPLGYQGIRIEQSKINKIIFCLNIRDHLGRVYYPEVMWAIFHSIAGINDEKVLQCEQVINILKVVKMKYKGLGKRVNLDALCGNKYYRNDLTAIKYLQAMKILSRWKEFQVIRRNQRKNQEIFQIADQIELQNSSNIQYNLKTSHKDKQNTQNDQTYKIEDKDHGAQKNEQSEISLRKRMDRTQRSLRYKNQRSILSDDFDKEADKEDEFTERK